MILTLVLVFGLILPVLGFLLASTLAVGSVTCSLIKENNERNAKRNV